ncbi:uncharacterized protein RSE6_16079 [Rhynchosporium secalis]|uniref:DUF202 domain-containing protein n=1 Tax=Rhynchosporium secalis TaxID=38038 RepID=A0A1E1MD64_RHYSE|nr:uncharacterized protein RSE6_16079 [Rhynchosporium secalis]
MAETADFNSPQAPGQLEEPSKVHLNSPDSISPGTDAREATELARLRSNYTRATSYRQAGSSVASIKPDGFLERFSYTVRAFWRRQISITVAHETCRDHLALERTFLGYLRTSLAVSMLGIVVAQLFRLQHAPVPNPHFGFFVLGKPLAIICQGTAIYTVLTGVFRSWRSQNAIVRGKAISGGIEIVALAGGIFAILIMFTVLLIAVDISKEI